LEREKQTLKSEGKEHPEGKPTKKHGGLEGKRKKVLKKKHPRKEDLRGKEKRVKKQLNT